MIARRMIVGTATLIGGGCLALAAAPVAGASPAASLVPRPGLLAPSQVPGFTISDVSRKAITHGNLASCDTFGPTGGVFATESLSRGGTSTPRGSTPLENITEVVVHTSGEAVVAKTLESFRGYITRCLSNQDGGDALAGSRMPVKYTIAARPLKALAGTGAGVAFTISGASKVVVKGQTVITKLAVPFLLYPAGGDLLVMVPVHVGSATSGKTNTVTLGTTGALSSVVTKLVPVAVKDF